MDIPYTQRPRFREKYKSIINAELLEQFHEKHPAYSDIDRTTFLAIIKTFNECNIQGVADNRNGVELLNGLGHIFMGSCPKPKESEKKNINFQTFTKEGVTVSHRNFDSDNRLLKIFYTNYHVKSSFMNRQVWSFRASTAARSLLSKAFKDSYTRYIEVNPTEKISNMFAKFRTKAYAQKINKTMIPEDYDEFNI